MNLSNQGQTQLLFHFSVRNLTKQLRKKLCAILATVVFLNLKNRTFKHCLSITCDHSRKVNLLSHGKKTTDFWHLSLFVFSNRLETGDILLESLLSATSDKPFEVTNSLCAPTHWSQCKELITYSLNQLIIWSVGCRPLLTNQSIANS